MQPRQPALAGGGLAWFGANVLRIPLLYAFLAAWAKAEIFCVGVELDRTAIGPRRERAWRELIAAVRVLYPGAVTYAANWDRAGEIPFWDALDFVGVDYVVAMAIDQNRVAAESDGVQLVTKAKSGAQVYGDEALLVTALHNLIANAIQYSPKRSRVGVGVSSRDGVVEIAVTDQGAGIPADEIDRVFERFFRGDPARSRITGGSGLGLSIVKHVAQNHSGDVRVWSQPGNGSTFTIRLPEAIGAASIQQGANK